MRINFTCIPCFSTHLEQLVTITNFRHKKRLGYRLTGGVEKVDKGQVLAGGGFTLLFIRSQVLAHTTDLKTTLLKTTAHWATIG